MSKIVQLNDDKSAVYLDSADKGGKHDEWGEDQEIDHKEVESGYRNMPLTPQKRIKTNATLALR